jgi:proline dehydrogenase
VISSVARGAFSLLASSGTLKRLASDYGMREPESFARRFVAGETIDDALVAAREIERTGMLVTMDLLGESVRTSSAATAATAEYRDLLARIDEAGISRNVSLKLTQLGLDVDRATCIDNLRRILDDAAAREVFVRIDMESSAYTAVTLDIFDTVWRIGYREVGVVIQSALRRSEADVRRLNAMGARVRLVKGAYNEPRSLAFTDKREVDAMFVDLMKELLKHGTYPAIATHDPAMIEATETCAAAEGLERDQFEFQMLFGVRRDLQAALTAEDYRFRVYVPFGREWYDYSIRRLRENPQIAGHVFRAMIGLGG